MRIAFANLGAEEPHAPPLVEGTPTARLAGAFVRLVEEPPWEELAHAEGLVPWLATRAAQDEAAARAVPLAFAPPDVVARVHDKAFALRCVHEHQLGVDDALSALARAFAPEELEAGALERHMAAWPDWARARATLKPRWGTSGRGRVAVRDGVLDAAARAALATLRARGGCVLEPFVARTEDISALFFVPREGPPALLGTTRQTLSVAGVYQGCTVRDDGRGALRAGTPIDDVVARDAARVVRAAQREGFFGFCGVDAFSYEGGARVRTAVELNARFTAGHVALASVLAARAPSPGLRTFSLVRDPLVS